MKTYEGKIIEATEDELYNKYLKEEYYTIMSFPQFLDNCKRGGTKIIQKNSKSEENITYENEAMFKYLSAIISSYDIGDTERLYRDIEIAKKWI